MPSAGEHTIVEELEKRVAKLESDRWEKWAQSAIIPIVLLLLGAWMNRTLQSGNEALERTRVTSQQVDVAQKMLSGMFDGNPTKAFATARLMRQIVDTLVAGEVDSILTAYYAEKVRANVQANQLDSAAAIVSAVRAIGGSKSGEQLSAAVGRADVSTVRLYVTKTDSVRLLEKAGFAALIAGDIRDAHLHFQKAEAMYPGYRISYEMERLLHRAVRDPQQVNAVRREAVRRYDRYMTPEVSGALRNRVEDGR